MKRTRYLSRDGAVYVVRKETNATVTVDSYDPDTGGRCQSSCMPRWSWRQFQEKWDLEELKLH
jgi:hypothetical protein